MGVPAPVVRRLCVSTAALWLATRMAMGAVGILRVSVPGAGGVAAVVLALAWLDLRRNDEVLLYANLGISGLAISLIVVVVSLTLEAVVAPPLLSVLPVAGADAGP